MAGVRSGIAVLLIRPGLRRSGRLRKLGVLAAAAALAAGPGVVLPAYAASGRSYREFPAPAPGAARSALAGCPQGSGPCASSDPRWAVSWYSQGDTTSCTWKNEIDWGDGSHLTQTVSGKPGTGDLITTDAHVFQKRGSYTITFTSQTLAGSCSAGDYTWDFTLKKLGSKLRLAALGDSYSSGEGAGHYYPGTASDHGCHRSPHAWPVLLDDYVAGHDAVLTTRDYFVACSGAVSKSLKHSFKGQPAQTDALSHLLPRPTLVTMTMGGNDLHFAAVLEDCYKHNCVTDGTLKDVEKQLPEEQETLASDYADLLTADKAATILIVGYPRIFQEEKKCEGDHSPLGFLPDEEKALNVLTGKIDAMIGRAAATVGVSYDDKVIGALAGHEMCARDSWVFDAGFDTRNDQQAGHPTTPGQRAIAKLVGK